MPIPAQTANYAEAFAAIWRYTLNTVLYAAVGGTLVVALSAVAGYTLPRRTSRQGGAVHADAGHHDDTGRYDADPFLRAVCESGAGEYAVGHHYGRGRSDFRHVLCRSFMAGISNELFDAAKIDGAGEFVVFTRMVSPLSVPVLMTLMIMQSVGIYNDYIWPLLTIKSNSIQMIGVGLTQFTNQFGISNMGVEFAAYIISAIPLVLLFSFGMKYYIQGVTQGALKI